MWIFPPIYQASCSVKHEVQEIVLYYALKISSFITTISFLLWPAICWMLDLLEGSFNLFSIVYFLFCCSERVLDLMFIRFSWITNFSLHIFRFQLLILFYNCFLLYTTIFLFPWFSIFFFSLLKVINCSFFEVFLLVPTSSVSLECLDFSVYLFCDRAFLKYLTILD